MVYVFFVVLPSLMSFFLSVTDVSEKAVRMQDVGRMKSSHGVRVGNDIM